MSKKAELVEALEDKGIDIEAIEGSGVNGNVLVEDLEAALARAGDETEDEEETTQEDKPVGLTPDGRPKVQKTIKGNRRINR